MIRSWHRNILSRHFSDLGLKQLSVESVVADEKEEYAITKEDLPEIMESYDKLTDLYLERICMIRFIISIFV